MTIRIWEILRLINTKADYRLMIPSNPILGTGLHAIGGISAAHLLSAQYTNPQMVMGNFLACSGALCLGDNARNCWSADHSGIFFNSA